MVCHDVHKYNKQINMIHTRNLDTFIEEKTFQIKGKICHSRRRLSSRLSPRLNLIVRCIFSSIIVTSVSSLFLNKVF